jgi:cardiolipin synthase
MPDLPRPGRGPNPGVNIEPGPQDDGWPEPPPVRLADGTAVQLLKDGQALRVAWEAIRSARESIALEIYIFHSDRTGRAFAELLAKRAREGLSVRVVYDSVGSVDGDRAMFDAMRAAGVVLREFHPWQPWRAAHGWRPFNRDHRKLLVVDNRVGVLGGQNLGDEYGSSWVVGQSDADSWRDTAIGLEGPSVQLLAAAFRRTWCYVDRGGPIRTAEFCGSSRSFLHAPASCLRDGPRPTHASRCACARPSVLEIPEDSVGVVASVPTPRSRLLPNLLRVLRNATTSIEMTMAYFAPPEQLLDPLCAKARAGVRVRLMLPARSDVPSLVIAARAFYETLIAAGVEVYERQHAVLHAKSLCVDGRLSVVGSTNLDYRSIQHNCELSAVVHSAPFGAQTRALFEHDVRFARRVPPDERRRRPVRDRLVQWALMRARYLL